MGTDQSGRGACLDARFLRPGRAGCDSAEHRFGGCGGQSFCHGRDDIGLSGDSQLLATSSLISQWAGTDPQAASVWAASFPQGEMRDQLFANLMNRWAMTDPSSAATWLDSLGADESRDAAVGALISRIASADPEAAVQWAVTINDTAMRETETQEAVQTWFEVDPASARDGSPTPT